MKSLGQTDKAYTEKKTFSRTTTISSFIDSDASVIWKLLTEAEYFPTWNTTVISIDGEIKEGNKIKLKSMLDSSRTFKLKIKEFIPNQRLVWGDAMGERVYQLEPSGNRTKFTMTEKIGSFMFPLFAGKIPSFDDSFEQFVVDLAREIESKKE